MNQEEFKTNILPLQPAMQLLAERILGNPDDAADTVQEVFISLWDKRSELDSIVRLKNYCLQSVRLRCIDILRKHKNDTLQPDAIETPTDQAMFDEVEENERRYSLLNSLLLQLPDKQRKIIQMKYFDNCDTQQMEASLQMSSANIYTSLSRALQSLREKMEKAL
ncbi:MAG: sigma-70 family RNA polymerase sigma factor [Bacteroidales bacterium]|nr:sigma-70 family RNA polymerase sigma factor [Bacteroidales bacterium]